MTTLDLDRVMQIGESLKQAPRWRREAYWAALDPAAVPLRLAFVAENASSGGIAGFAIVSLTLPEAELETIAVVAESQRRGVARQLLSELAEALRSAGVDVLALEVRASNEPALALYRSFGFSESGRRPRYYLDPVEDAVLMRLQFGVDG